MDLEAKKFKKRIIHIAIATALVFVAFLFFTVGFGLCLWAFERWISLVVGPTWSILIIGITFIISSLLAGLWIRVAGK